MRELTGKYRVNIAEEKIETIHWGLGSRRIGT